MARITLGSLATLATGIALAASGALSQGCTCEGCGDAFLWGGVFPPSTLREHVETFRIRLCRNDRCEEGSLAELDEVGSISPFADEFVGFSVQIPWMPDADAISIRVSGFVREPRDGDRWSLAILDGAGTRVLGLDETAVQYRVTNWVLDCRWTAQGTHADGVDAGR